MYPLLPYALILACQAGRQKYSVSVADLGRLIQHLLTLPAFYGVGRALNSNHIRDYLMAKRAVAKDLFFQFFQEGPAMVALTYEWTIPLADLLSFLNGPTLRDHNRRHPDLPPVPTELELLTVWIDVLQLDQNSSDMAGQLLQSEAEYGGADLHLILGTRTVGTRAWCLQEAATRNRAGKKSYLLKSLKCNDPAPPGELVNRFDVASFVFSASGDFFNEMQATKAEDLELIKRRIRETYGHPESFNSAVLRVFQDAVL